MNDRLEILNDTRIWFCDCKRVHIESNHVRLSFLPEEFISFLRHAARKKGIMKMHLLNAISDRFLEKILDNGESVSTLEDFLPHRPHPV
jgi:heterodisulfide reductase subunit C